MSKLKWQISVIGILFSFLAFLGIRLFAASNNNIECPIKTFDNFAYLPDEATFPIVKILPEPPWQDEGIIPKKESSSLGLGDATIKMIRTNNEDQEIWIFERPFESFEGTTIQDGAFLVYYTNSQTWGRVSAKIADSNLVVGDLFVTKDGTIWGGLFERNYSTLPDVAPVLSRFNETTQRFETAPGGFDILISQDLQEQGGYIDVPAIVLDEKDNFWIFMQKDGIYQYDTKTGTLDRQTDLAEIDIDLLDATLSIDGSIYFKVIYPYRTSNFLFQFVPETGEITSLEVPDQTWRLFSGMLGDRKGNLWLGAMGYLSERERWHRIHPDPQRSYDHIGEPRWLPAHLMLESSNGLLWYTKANDMSGIGDGTAWYDPKTRQGCLFTNISSYIVEDGDKQLWMVADGKLYRYPLEP